MSWHSGKLPIRPDGAVLPILHLNGWKIANPTVLARIPEPELADLLRGYGYYPVFGARSRPGRDASGTGRCWTTPSRRSARCRRRPGLACPAGSAGLDGHGPRWPMIVFRTPKGWTGPKVVDGLPVEHLAGPSGAAGRGAYQPRAPAPAAGLELFLPAGGAVCTPMGGPTWTSSASSRVASAGWAATRTPTAACSCATWPCPTSASTRSRSVRPAPTRPSPPGCSAGCSATSWRDNLPAANFRVFGPDETASNRLEAVIPGQRERPGKRPRCRWMRTCSGRTGHGNTSRDHLPGLAGGILADRPGTASSPATRRSSTSSTRCSTSTRSG